MQVIHENEVKESSNRTANTMGFIPHVGRSSRHMEREYNGGTGGRGIGI